ncbi:MAG: phosphotransferase [Acidimicrobiales bacterium]|jgi:hypothetical protein
MANQAKPEIPQSTAELTAKYLTKTVGPKYGGGTVTAVSTEQIGQGIGFMGELQRCHLQWSGASADAPSSVIAKLPAQPGNNRSLGEALQAYAREIRVYSGLRDDLGIPMPAYMYSEMDPNRAPWLERVFVFLFDKLPLAGVSWLLNRLIKLSGTQLRRYLLIMEDISDARPPSQEAGGTIDDAVAGLQVLARFHATNWMAQAKVDAEPILWSIGRTPKVVQASYSRNRDKFMERFGSLLGPARITKMDQVQANTPELIGQLAAAPWTLIHGDYRLDNLLFRPNGDVVVVDFQGVGTGRAGWDVAYFITTALEPHHRVEEEQLLRAYHEALVGEGITDYSYEALVVDCDLTKDLLAHRLVAGDDLLDTDRAGEDEDLLDVLVGRVAGWTDSVS